MWTYILMERMKFLNIYFDASCHEVITEIPKVNHFLLEEWRAYFYKWCEFGHTQVFTVG